MAVDWSTDIPRDLVLCFANRLMVSLEDFIAFGAVCKSWSSAAMEVKENYLASISTSTSTSTGLRLLAYQVPLLMLPVRLTLPRGVAGGDVTVEFYSLTAKGNKIYRSKLLDAKGKMCYSSLGWLVTVSKDLEFKLLHPFKHAMNIQLPDGRTKDIGKFVLSSSPSWTSDYVVMFYTSTTLAYCRPGLGENWTELSFQMVDNINIISDLTYYRGQFYVVDCCGRVLVVCDIDDPNRAKLKVVAPEINQKELLGTRRHIKQLYLAECAGALLLVFCLFSNKYESTTACRVFEVPFNNGKSWNDSEVKDLGNRAIFLSQSSSSFCIEVTDYSGCKANCIYFMNNMLVSSVLNIDMGIYNMSNASIDREFGKSFNYDFKDKSGSHLWIQPSFE
ncbi:uncharacterized protein LOC133737850 [Rosa rugosa]|uniref:uncharacterized protein LOC133737850 n=1 Tax=Rosa rugosa TaxID=74645 RepID=UPI002B404F79|nr:uncharacterized protein LOC133737850 [Rosa rugosa]